MEFLLDMLFLQVYPDFKLHRNHVCAGHSILFRTTNIFFKLFELEIKNGIGMFSFSSNTINNRAHLFFSL